VTANERKLVDAISRSPKGQRRLRQTVLWLAVQGFLTTERRDHAILPTGWRMTSLRRSCVVIGGATPSKSRPDYWGGPVPWISPKDMKSRAIADSLDHVSESAVAASHLTVVPPGSVLVVVRGMILTHSVPAAITTAPVTINQDMKALVPRDPEIAPYLLLLLEAFEPVLLTGIQRSTHGTGKLPTDVLLDLELPLPPVEQQRQIMDRAAELTGLLAALRDQEANTVEAGTRALSGSLSAMRRAVGRTEAREAWSRIVPRLNDLVSGPSDVQALKALTLDLAMRGFLTQFPPPAGGPDRSKVESEWRTMPAGEVFQSITDGDHLPPPQVETGVPFLVIGDLSGLSPNFRGSRLVPSSYYDELDPSRRPRRGDLLFTVTGSLGLVIEVTTDEPFAVQRHIAIMRPRNGANIAFLRLVLQSPVVQEEARRRATGTAQKTVGLGTLRSIRIPVPPEAEQQGIVEAVAPILRRLEALSGRLDSLRSVQDHLADTYAMSLRRRATVNA
jgi:type I restriction enzyme S subunit